MDRKLKSKKELAQAAAPYFKKNPKAQCVYACQDGHLYPENREGLAETHNREIVKGEVFTITREDVAGKPDPNVPTGKWTNDQLKEYMTANEIAFEGDDNKTDLLAKIEAAKT